MHVGYNVASQKSGLWALFVKSVKYFARCEDMFKDYYYEFTDECHCE